jgi:hypothetical protein
MTLVVQGDAMPTEPRDRRAESTQVLLAWGLPAGEGQEGTREAMLLWLTGGGGLLMWTALALWLTA